MKENKHMNGVYIYKWRRYCSKLFAYVQKIQKSEENTQAFANVGLLHVFLKHLEVIRNTLVLFKSNILLNFVFNKVPVCWLAGWERYNVYENIDY